VSVAKVHRPTQAGISGSSKDGSDSIVLNGGYADDEDHGGLIVYTGHGGQDGHGNQVKDQDLSDSGNAGLKISFDEQLPVRVVRGSSGDPRWSPISGYRYDGLYRVSRYWEAPGIDGYKVCRYILERLGQESEFLPNHWSSVEATTAIAMTQQLIKDPLVSLHVKRIHDWTCQMCGTRIEIPGGPYAEAVHIKPLGRPDDGPDNEANILCLCSNHRKLFDSGGVVVDSDWRLINVVIKAHIGELRRDSKHRLTQEFLGWHRERWFET